MKTKVAYIVKSFFICFLILFTIFGFSPSTIAKDFITNIENDINKSDVIHLSTHFNEPIELVFDNSFDLYSKKQANAILKDWLIKNAPDSFKISSERTVDDTTYLIGTLNSNSAKFQVYMIVKDSNDGKLISHLRIDQQPF